MALFHQQSCECTTTGLDLFTVPPTQTSVEQGLWIEHHPLASLTENGPIEFVVKGGGEEYVDLANTLIHLQAKILKPDGGDLDQNDRVAPTNLWLHALFSEVDVSLNGVLVTTSTNTYPYRAYIETLLNYGKGAKTSQLRTSLFHKDQDIDDYFGKKNRGYSSRKTKCELSKTMDLLGRIHADIFMQEKYLLNGVDLRLRFVQSKDAFALMSPPPADDQPASQYRVKILRASLFVRKCKLNPSVVLGHGKALQTTTAKYPLKRVVTKVFSVPSGNMNVVQDNLFLNQLPKRLVIGAVTSKSFNGDYAESPFAFKHFNANSLTLYLDGQQVPFRTLKPDFENDLYARSYFTLFSGTGNAFGDFGNDISYEDYRTGYTLFAFDLTPSLTDGDAVELIKTGSLRLEMSFGKPLPTPIHIIVYGELDAMVEIDRARQVITDFSS